ncbi:MAG: VacJ family lipoprotein [Limnobacter sp.]|nr:VacJ family lipoprotein [Limnobacter sp.]
MTDFTKLLMLACIGLSSAACTTVQEPTQGDPFESFNRSVHDFNEGFDRAIAKPVAKGYEDVVAWEFRTCVTNFFNNLDDVSSAVNNLLQGKIKAAFTDTCRVVINSTVGILGLADAASEFGLERTNEDFGQTLGYWGVSSGPYLVLPFLGPSSMRDLTGQVVDGFVEPLPNHEPVDERLVATAVDAVDTRARLLPATDLVDRIALDKYSFIRDAYLARRESQARDGKNDEGRLNRVMPEDVSTIQHKPHWPHDMQPGSQQTTASFWLP